MAKFSKQVFNHTYSCVLLCALWLLSQKSYGDFLDEPDPPPNVTPKPITHTGMPSAKKNNTENLLKPTAKKANQDVSASLPKKDGAVSTTHVTSQKTLPLIFESEGLSGSKAKGLIVLRKKVSIEQGSLKLWSELARIYFNDTQDSANLIIAEGGVRFVKKDPDPSRHVQAQSDTSEYDVLNEVVLLKGHAVLQRGADRVQGESIRYDLKNGLIKASKVSGIVKQES